jgi:PST family polysaccharide transporter
MMNQKSILVSGILYSACSKYAGMVISLVISAILARFISPEDFGVFAIASVFLVFFAVLYDSGFSVAVIQQKDLSTAEIVSIFSFTVYISFGIACLFFLIAPLIADFYKNRELVVICRILSVNLLFASLNTIPNSLLLKEKRFKFIAVRTVLVQFVLGIVSSIAAITGLRIYALLINPVGSAIMLFAINYATYPIVFKFRMNLGHIKKVFPYSAFQFLFNFINYFSRNLDNLLIGKFMGTGSLGYYEKSYRLMMMPLQMITHVITPVIHPVFSDYSNDKKRLYVNYLKIVQFLVGVGFPLSVLLFFTAKELILIVFGRAWEPSIPVFRILSISVGVQVIMSSSGSIYQAAGNTKHLFISGFLCAMMTVTGISIGVFGFKTLYATAGFISGAMLINFVMTYSIMIKITLKQSLRPFLRELVRPSLCAIVSGIGLLLGDTYFEGNLFISLSLKTMIVGVVLAGMNFKSLVTYIKTRGK